MWGDMVRQLDGIVVTDERNDHQIEDFDPGDDEYDPLECAEADDDL